MIVIINRFQIIFKTLKHLLIFLRFLITEIFILSIPLHSFILENIIILAHITYRFIAPISLV